MGIGAEFVPAARPVIVNREGDMTSIVRADEGKVVGNENRLRTGQRRRYIETRPRWLFIRLA
jgi:hypothetical protein